MYAHVYIYTYVHTYVQAQRKRIPSSNGNAVGKLGDQTTFDKSGDRRLIGKKIFMHAMNHATRRE